MTYEEARQKAACKLIAARECMDEAQTALDKAEDEYHQACKALDDLERQAFVDGELKQEG